MKKPKQIDISQEEIAEIQNQLEKSLNKALYEKAKVLIELLIYLLEAVKGSKASIRKLMKMLFGWKTEKAPKKSDPPKEDNKPQEKQPAKGHGRNGSADYTGAAREMIPHESLKHGDRCPCCSRGKVYGMKEPCPIIRVIGSAPIQATVYELEKLRCNLCGEIFSAKPPEGIGDKQYDETAGAMIALLKYGSGMPFYRLEKLQEGFGVPLAASTQWDIVEAIGKLIAPAFAELIRQAAQGEVIHNDDTTMKVLALMKVKNQRKGVYTTGILSICVDYKVAIFKTGNKHAGENLTDVLMLREHDLNPPIQMCDGLSRNQPSEEFKTIMANCMTHGRRNFVDIKPDFPEECNYVIDMLGMIYKNDEVTKSEKMSPENRLDFHKQHSAPLMAQLLEWMNKKTEDKEVEPNSGLGKAFSYMRKRWDKLTLFLRVAGAPIDNNLCEQILKRVILHRKNALFYKTLNGAMVGDTFMSLIHTCYLNGVNAFEYLTELQRHWAALIENPSQWMPWNFRDTLASLGKK